MGVDEADQPKPRSGDRLSKGTVRVRISVFGIGYVGAVFVGCLADLGHEIVGVDVSAEKVSLLAAGQLPIVEADMAELIARGVASGRIRATADPAEAVAATDISLIAVGTPSGPDGGVVMTAVDDVTRAIGAAIGAKSSPHTVVMRSTVPPGTADERVIPALERGSGRRLGDGLHYYGNPEFLREGSAVRDFHAPPYTLIGAPPGDDAALMREIYSSVAAPIHVVPYRVAEGVKYLANVFHAVKLVFANEAGAVLSAYGVDALEAFRLFREDRVLNISPAYLRPGYAFGGSCLPKDIRSFLSLADDRAVAAPFLSQLLPSNQANVERTFQAVARHGRQPVSLFGLAFKSGTDDLRESPYVELAERLIGRGFELRIFDRSVHAASILSRSASYIDRELPHLRRVLCATPEAALEGTRMVVVGHVAAEAVPALLAALDGHTVIDLAGIAALRDHSGIAYHGLCW
jgi:GDP-mannose 6-dehydrogenase